MLNPTGIHPVEYKVLIKPETVDDKSTGGLFLPDTARDREQMAVDRGVLVECAGMAFSDWKGLKPAVGNRVVFDKYKGTLMKYRNKDGVFEDYRLCNDKNICAILEEEDDGTASD